MKLDDYEWMITEAIKTFASEIRESCDQKEVNYENINRDEADWDKEFTEWLKLNPHEGNHPS